MTEFLASDCEVWRQHGTDPGWRAKHKPTGIEIVAGHSWSEECPDGILDGLRSVVEREALAALKREAHYDKLGQEIAEKNGWTVHCRGGCAECDWQGFLQADGTPPPRRDYRARPKRRFGTSANCGGER